MLGEEPLEREIEVPSFSGEKRGITPPRGEDGEYLILVSSDSPGAAITTPEK